MSLIQGPSNEHDTTIVTPAPLEPPVVAYETVAAPPAVVGEVRTSNVSRFEPDALIAAAVGLVLLVVGLIAVVRGGFDGPMSDPVVQVLGFSHTTTLGLIEIVLGVLLLGAGAGRSRGSEVFFGLVLAVAGFVGAVQTSSFKKDLALESSMAWLATLAGAAVVLAALVLPRFARRSVVVEQR